MMKVITRCFQVRVTTSNCNQMLRVTRVLRVTLKVRDDFILADRNDFDVVANLIFKGIPSVDQSSELNTNQE